jgi:hypothetical protein
MARAWLGQQPDEMRRAIAPSYVLVALFYLMLSWAPSIYVAGAAVIGAHAAGSVLWVFSTVLLQMSVPDRFRGRVFSAELALLMIISAASSFACGYALDNWGASPFLLTRVLGALFILPTLGWLLIERRCTSGAGEPGSNFRGFMLRGNGLAGPPEPVRRAPFQAHCDGSGCFLLGDLLRCSRKAPSQPATHSRLAEEEAAAMEPLDFNVCP